MTRVLLGLFGLAVEAVVAAFGPIHVRVSLHWGPA
jgi:hypothetical protein